MVDRPRCLPRSWCNRPNGLHYSRSHPPDESRAGPWHRTHLGSSYRRCHAAPPSRDQAIVPILPQSETFLGWCSQRPVPAESRGRTARRTRSGKLSRLNRAGPPTQGRHSDPRCRRIEIRLVPRTRKRNGADTRAEAIGRRAVDIPLQSSRTWRSMAGRLLVPKRLRKSSGPSVETRRHAPGENYPARDR